MNSPAVRLSPSRAIELWLAAALIGAIAQLLLTPAVFGWQGMDLFPEVAGVSRSLYLTLWLITGTLALLGFAWVLLRGPVGRMSAMDGAVIFFGMSSPLGIVAGLYMVALVSSWMNWRTTLIAVALGIVGALSDVRLQAKTALGPDVLLGAVVLLAGAVLIGLWWGRVRQARTLPAVAVPESV
ncbi:hypothetical protein [Corynebacterium sp.]|uniref:hypothetical protein n=1 Tax=Corynebacterium sp. TaxID=1720 RepID=UPI0026DEE051|nr:hypothetical protein [Corynebacterium sp.]MDO5512938.1 hypothetical protein [Corynebacterium sp.]